MSEIKAKLIVCRDNETIISTCTQNDRAKLYQSYSLDRPGVCQSRSEGHPVTLIRINHR